MMDIINTVNDLLSYFFQDISLKAILGILLVWSIIVLILHFIFLLSTYIIPRIILSPLLKPVWQNAKEHYKKNKGSIFLLSLLILIFLIAIREHSLFEFLVLIAIWLQVETQYITWEAEAERLTFNVDVRNQDSSKHATLRVKNNGRVFIQQVKAERAILWLHGRDLVEIKPGSEKWKEYVLQQRLITNLEPGKEIELVTINVSKAVLVYAEIRYTPFHMLLPEDKPIHLLFPNTPENYNPIVILFDLPPTPPLMKALRSWYMALSYPIYVKKLKYMIEKRLTRHVPDDTDLRVQ
ncbi:MAG: hypothetical protein ACO2OS_01770 [Thermosphaera aggregans]|jgi:hypothetical protein